jgi:hypothetical protein
VKKVVAAPVTYSHANPLYVHPAPSFSYRWS